MKYFLQRDLWAYLESLAVGILLTAPPLVLRTLFNTRDTPSILFPAVILTWGVVFTIYLGLSKDVRLNCIPVGFGGLVLIWLSYGVFMGVDRDLLVKYGVAAAVIAFLWWIQLLLEEDYVINWASIGLIIATVAIHWWGLRSPGAHASRLPASILITISSVASIWVVSLLAWQSISRAVARLEGWILLASLSFVAPFLWLANRPDPTPVASLICFVVALLSTLGALGLRALFENIPLMVHARARTFLTQSKRGKEYFDLQQFRKSIHPLQEAVISFQSGVGTNYIFVPNEWVADQIMLAYAYSETGQVTKAAETALNVTSNLFTELYKKDSYTKRIALTLLLVSNTHRELFTEQQSDTRYYLWTGLIDDDEKLRALAQKIIRSAVPLSITALIDRFKVESHPAIQKHILQFLHEFDKTAQLFQQSETFLGLFSVLESRNPHTQALANDAIMKADQLASGFLLAGLDRENRSIREYSMWHLIKLGQFDASIEHIKQQVPKLEPQILLTVLRARLMPDSLEPGSSLGDLIVTLGNPHGLDVLANLRDPAIKQEAVNAAWNNIHGALRDQLPDVIWSDALDVAIQAAHLYYRDPHFIPNTLAKLKEGTLAERRYAAQLAARVMLLLRDELPREKAAMVDLKPEVSLHPTHEYTSVYVQLTGMPKQTESLPIPVIYVEPGNPILLLVNNERYRLNVQVRSSASGSVRLKFFALADLVDIPEYAKDFNLEKLDSSSGIEFQLLPNKVAAFEDRLTLTMRMNGRGERLLAYDLFICEPYVLNGLSAI